jgi:uncharacterized protein YegP (UPF0339 family)
MAGMFELFVDAESHFRFRLKGPDGTLMAVSSAFEDKSAAVAGIAAVRECAGMGLITDLCPSAAPPEAAPAQPAAPEPGAPVQACDDKRMPVSRVRSAGHAKPLHRPVPARHRSGVA